MDDETVSKPKAHEVGMVLDAMSVEELQARVAMLETEIERLEAAIKSRGATRQAAESIFKF